jgi:hypothetical protein
MISKFVGSNTNSKRWAGRLDRQNWRFRGPIQFRGECIETFSSFREIE